MQILFTTTDDLLAMSEIINYCSSIKYGKIYLALRVWLVPDTGVSEVSIMTVILLKSHCGIHGDFLFWKCKSRHTKIDSSITAADDK